MDEEESEALLPHSSQRGQQFDTNMQGITLGKIRAYWLGCVVCMGGFLFGYDSGM
jgi:hypothetical protein